MEPQPPPSHPAKSASDLETYIAAIDEGERASGGHLRLELISWKINRESALFLEPVVLRCSLPILGRLPRSINILPCCKIQSPFSQYISNCVHHGL